MGTFHEVANLSGSGACAPRRPFLRSLLAQLLALVGFLTVTAADADELSLLINGKALHLGAPAGRDLNERNWGLGLQFDWNRAHTNWVPFATVSGFRDSNGNPSYYAGGGALYRFQFDGVHVDAGAVGFLMTRKDYNDQKPFLGALPAFSVGNKNIAVNLTYVPKMDPKAVPLWFFQLKITLSNFP